MSKLEQALELNTIIEEVSQLASFSLGKKRILALEPSYKPLVIHRNLQYTKEALCIIQKNDLCPFYGMKDLTLVFSQAKKGSLLSATDINDVKQFLLGIQAIVRFYDSLQEVKLEYISELFQSLIEYPKLIQHIDHCIDDYGAVLDTASMELKGIRLSLKKVDMEITQAVQRFIQTHKDSVVDAIVAYRNDRAVILVKSSDKNQFGGLSYGESASGQASYIEPSAVLHLNNRKQELLSKEKEEIERVLRQLSNEIATVSDSLLANLETVSILDEIFAKALWGQKHDAVCADIQKGNDYILVKARHPLIDPKKVVANTYRIADGKKMLLITGPNTGGKTVSLKILGLFVLMSYCGIPVPAEEAHLPFFDQVFEDIGDDQSVISSLSSFSAHIQKQAYITNHATVNSLVLLDELGSGTDPKEGESLGIALLNHLREIGCITIVTTHFSRLKAYGKRHEDILLASVQFDMDKLMPTYRYIQGLTGQSNAINVAERYGLPKEVIKYARFLMKQSDSEEDTLISKLEEQLNEVEANNLKLQEQLTALQKEKDELHKQKIQFQKEKDLWQNKKEEEAADYLESVKEEADQLLKEIRNTKNVKFHEALEKRKEISALMHDEEEIDESNYSYQVGDVVELRNSNQVCEIIEIGKKEIRISLNGREMRVKPEQIRPSTRVIPKFKKQNTTTINVASASRFQSMSIECNLIGLRVEEALVKLEDYLAEAKIHGLTYCRIIHGDGTGKLRLAVHERLKKDKRIKSFMIAPPNEGGTGATIITFV